MSTRRHQVFWEQRGEVVRQQTFRSGFVRTPAELRPGPEQVALGIYVEEPTRLEHGMQHCVVPAGLGMSDRAPVFSTAWRHTELPLGAFCSMLTWPALHRVYAIKCGKRLVG